jgi:hypothetical protein
MVKVIVGMYGLVNKPDKEVLKVRWVKAIREGLTMNSGINSPGNKRHNHYKSYGYLRTPVRSAHVVEFLES